MGAQAKKRSHDGKAARPSKKQKRQSQQHPQDSGSEDEGRRHVQSINPLDDSDDDDIHNAVVDDGAVASDSDDFADQLESSDDDLEEANLRSQKHQKSAPVKKKKVMSRRSIADAIEAEQKAAGEGHGLEAGESDSDANPDAPEDVENEEDEEEEDDEDDQADDSGSDDSQGDGASKPKSKRNDPDAFASSMSRILSTKLSSSRRADPILARSAAAQKAAKAAADSALELKAKRQMRQQKREAKEKGRVRNVLIATRNEHTGETEGSTAEMLEAEKRLRKVAQRGVVKLFNAVRGAQVKAAEADRAAKKDGVIGHNRKEAKVNEMSKKGFLDLIASGGGGLKKGAIEEA